MRQIVHLKLSPTYPPEVREAAVVREEGGECSALLKVRSEDGTLELIVPFAPCAEFDPAMMVSGSGRILADRLTDPAYQRLMDALRQLSRSME